MQLSDFEYVLPKELIAQTALVERTKARLLVLDRKTGSIRHRIFQSIADYFEKGDVLVLNDTKVLPARIFARRKTGARVEILVLKSVPGTTVPGSENPAPAVPGTVTWEALVKPSGRIREGEDLVLECMGAVSAPLHNDIFIRVLDGADHKTGFRHIQFLGGESPDSILRTYGHIPLPPYIDREDTPADRELYQTVFAKCPGAVASPTAGLHFDEALLSKLEAKGVEILFITLHVSYGTFQPVVSEDLTEHRMHQEYFEISDEVGKRIDFAKADGRRVTACGTTVVRTLESQASVPLPTSARFKGQMNNEPGTFGSGTVHAGQGTTDLFIYPPYDFKIADRMITNFHLPRTTLLMLTSAFAGHELLMKAYREAIQEKYRFYSYGDGMLIV
ncbi:MAG: tRNA preQ1(34) S-adenosylmethionine ribosyltransferase-isomerase QueA [Candidatus Omnitrophica bacterium]|nr:tRNA preQ1(34) S-adenosylmethionine ribosyltransferase-isomerase QueA [Candidatus Omnitrophota bacterium]